MVTRSRVSSSKGSKGSKVQTSRNGKPLVSSPLQIEKATLTPIEEIAIAMATKGKTELKPVNPFVTVFYAHLLFRALMGEFGINITRFYKSAIAYHKKLNTQFPRPRNSAIPLLSHDDAVKYLRDNSAKGLQAGSAVSQRLFDQMMVDTIRAKIKGIKFQ